ncbi:Uncharacterised protein [Mycobacteroides abscessus subsp. abscessus]|nr:Uncharacterised protein [Mycobacteroides abscessus subsp. abscessus]
MYECAEFGVDGGQHFGQRLDLRDFDAAGGEAFGHFQADVSGADDDCGLGVTGGQGVHHLEGVAHGVQQVHTVGRAESVGSGQAGDGWAGRDGAGAHDQGVVGQLLRVAVWVKDIKGVGRGVDGGGAGAGQDPHAGGGQVGGGAVRQVRPVGDFPGDVVRDPADGEVRVVVGDHDGDVGGGVEFTDAQGGADPGVAAADRNDVSWAHECGSPRTDGVVCRA